MSRKSYHQYREIITPLRQIPFSLIKNHKKRAAFILHLAKFPYRKIGTILKLSKNTITEYVAYGYEIYPDLKK